MIGRRIRLNNSRDGELVVMLPVTFGGGCHALALLVADLKEDHDSYAREKRIDASGADDGLFDQ